MTHIDTDRYQLAQHIETAGIEKELGVVTSYVGSGLGIALLFHPNKIRKHDPSDWYPVIASKETIHGHAIPSPGHIANLSEDSMSNTHTNTVTQLKIPPFPRKLSLHFLWSIRVCV